MAVKEPSHGALPRRRGAANVDYAMLINQTGEHLNRRTSQGYCIGKPRICKYSRN